MPNFNFVVSGGEHRFQGVLGGSVSAGDFVKESGGTIVVATDGAAICGLVVCDGTTGEQCTVIEAPVVVQTSAASGVNFALGDTVYIATSTTVDAGAQGNSSCGTVVNYDPATAGRVDIDLQTRDSVKTTHA